MFGHKLRLKILEWEPTLIKRPVLIRILKLGNVDCSSMHGQMIVRWLGGDKASGQLSHSSSRQQISEQQHETVMVKHGSGGRTGKLDLWCKTPLSLLASASSIAQIWLQDDCIVILFQNTTGQYFCWIISSGCSRVKCFPCMHVCSKSNNSCIIVCTKAALYILYVDTKS